jgi:hypothetical protein
MVLHYDYVQSRKYCEQIGLVWLGDDFIANADADAFTFSFTQAQVDVAMRHHLWQVKHLFTPASYPFRTRLLLALYFLTGWKPY